MYQACQTYRSSVQSLSYVFGDLTVDMKEGEEGKQLVTLVCRATCWLEQAGFSRLKHQRVCNDVSVGEHHALWMS